VVKRSAIKTLGFKQPGNRLKVVLAFLKPLLAGKDLEKTHVNALVEGGDGRPTLQVAERVVIGEVFGKVFQNLCLQASELTTLRDQPRVEAWATIQFQPLQKLASEGIGNLAQVIQGMGRDAQMRSPVDLQGIDIAVRKIKPHRVCFGSHPA
jgi:hypothetical protein